MNKTPEEIADEILAATRVLNSVLKELATGETTLEEVMSRKKSTIDDELAESLMGLVDDMNNGNVSGLDVFNITVKMARIPKDADGTPVSEDDLIVYMGTVGPVLARITEIFEDESGFYLIVEDGHGDEDRLWPDDEFYKLGTPLGRLDVPRFGEDN